MILMKNIYHSLFGVWKYDDKGITDGVGGNVRMNEPQQGCFVKNEEYAGTERRI